MAHLVLTPAVTRHIETLAERAHAEPLTFHHIRRLHRRDVWPADVLARFQLDVPRGYHLRFSTAHYRPGWVCRHLTVRGEGRWPERQDVDQLMRLTGFRHPLEACVNWYDGDARRTVHVLEPLNGDFSPIWSS
jgi:hypothetical protein